MEILHGMGLGIVQGLTEFLPVSSSGHLVISEALFGIKHPESVVFEVALHAATLLAVVIYYRKRLARLMQYILAAAQNSKNPSHFLRDPDGRFIILILIGCIPTACIGILFKNHIEAMFDNPILAGFALLVTGILLSSTRFKKTHQRDVLRTSIAMALLIGTVQGIALVPGISRSGITISTALLLGMDRKLSADFSFLLSVPAILGATLISLKDITDIQSIGIGATIGGFIAAAIVGYLSLWILIRIVRHGKFYLFSPYCFALGVFTILYFM